MSKQNPYPHGDPPPAWLNLRKDNEILEAKLADIVRLRDQWDLAYRGIGRVGSWSLSRFLDALSEVLDDVDA